MSFRFRFSDIAWAYVLATVFSGLPSTLLAFATGADPLAPTLAAGAMLAPSTASPGALVAAAAIVHPAVSLVWTGVFALLLPRAHLLPWAVLGSAAVALLDLRVVAPLAFPSVAALPFWPQFADHLMWGALLGATLRARLRRGERRPSTNGPP